MASERSEVSLHDQKINRHRMQRHTKLSLSTSIQRFQHLPQHNTAQHSTQEKQLQQLQLMASERSEVSLHDQKINRHRMQRHTKLSLSTSIQRFQHLPQHNTAQHSTQEKQLQQLQLQLMASERSEVSLHDQKINRHRMQRHTKLSLSTSIQRFQHLPQHNTAKHSTHTTTKRILKYNK
jgi:phosphate uptake regulator